MSGSYALGRRAAIGLVALIPPQLLHVILRVAAIVVCARRAGAAGVLPLRLRREIELQPRPFS